MILNSTKLSGRYSCLGMVFKLPLLWLFLLFLLTLTNVHGNPHRIEIEIQVDDLPNDIGWTLQCQDKDSRSTTYVDRKPPRKLLQTGTCGCEDPGVAFCNYDFGENGGTCERCKDNVEDCYKDNWLVLNSPRTRSNPGTNRTLPLKGAEDCVLWCSQEREPSSYVWYNETTNATTNNNESSEPFLEDGTYHQEFYIPEGSNCELTVFQNHGFGTKCSNYDWVDRCYRVHQWTGPNILQTIAEECGGWNADNNIEVPFVEIDFTVSSSPGGLTCNDGAGGPSGIMNPVIFYPVFIVFFIVVVCIIVKTGANICGGRGLFGPSLEAKMRETPTTATGEPATNALGATVEERLETLESIKKYGLSPEEFEQMKDEVLSAPNALGVTVEERLKTLESITKYLSEEEFEQTKNKVLSSNC